MDLFTGRLKKNHSTIELQLLGYSQVCLGVERVQEKRKVNSCSIFLVHMNLHMPWAVIPTINKDQALYLYTHVLTCWIPSCMYSVIFLRPWTAPSRLLLTANIWNMLFPSLQWQLLTPSPLYFGGVKTAACAVHSLPLQSAVWMGRLLPPVIL